MSELLREPDLARMGLLRSILEARGIETWIRNEAEYNALGLSGFGTPKLWPALCVVKEEDHELAKEILSEHLDGDAALSQTEILCPACGETNPGNFEVCWSCEASLLSS